MTSLPFARVLGFASRAALGLLVGVGAAACSVDLGSSSSSSSGGSPFGSSGTIEIPPGIVSARYEMSLERFDTTTGAFTVLPAPPTKRNLFHVEEVRGKLVIVGGVDEDLDYVASVDVFDPATATWNVGARWPNVRNAQFVAVSGLLCAMGGTKGLALEPKTDVECYDVDADAWSKRAPIPADVGYTDPAVHEGRVYLLGGTNWDGQARINLAHDKAFAYDPAGDAWATLPSLPSGRGDAAVVRSGDRFLVLGGFRGTTPSTIGKACETEALAFDTKTQAWSTVPQMPHARLIGFGVDPVGSGEVATYFGLGSGPTLDRFEPATGRWRSGTEPTEKIDPGVYTRVAYGGDLFLLVVADKLSSNGTSASGKLWKYASAEDRWSIVGRRAPDQRDALFYGKAIGTSLYFAGAFTNLTRTK